MANSKPPRDPAIEKEVIRRRFEQLQSYARISTDCGLGLDAVRTIIKHHVAEARAQSHEMVIQTFYEQTEFLRNLISLTASRLRETHDTRVGDFLLKLMERLAKLLSLDNNMKGNEATGATGFYGTMTQEQLTKEAERMGIKEEFVLHG